VAAAQRVVAMHSATAAERLQQRGCCGRRSAAVVRSTVMDGDAAMDMKNTTIN